MVNKYQKYIRNTKKLMHKVGKNWVIVSLVLLGLISGSTFIEKVSANESSHNNINNTMQTHLDTPTNNLSHDLNSTDINSNSRLSQYINTNQMVDLANEAKINHAVPSYTDLLNMADSNNIQTFLKGAQIGTTQSGDSTWLGAFNQATKDFKVITNNGNGSNTSFNKFDQDLNHINNEANGISSIYELFTGKSSTTSEAAMSIATNTLVQEKLPPLIDTTRALTSIMSNASARTNYDNIVNDAINLTNTSEVSALNDMHNNLNNLDNFLSTNSNGYIGSELGDDANAASSIANSLQPKPAPSPAPAPQINNNPQPSQPIIPIMPNYDANTSTFMSSSYTVPSVSSSSVSISTMMSSSNDSFAPSYSENNVVSGTNTNNNTVTLNNTSNVSPYKDTDKSKHYVYVKLIHKIMLHTNKHFTHKNAVRAIYPGMTFKIKKIVKDSHLTRYLISYKHHNYFITANSHFVTNAYIQRSDFKYGHKMMIITNRHIGEYKGLKFNKHSFIRTIMPKKKLVVKRVIIIGKGKMTRLKLTNNYYISANKSLISVYK